MVTGRIEALGDRGSRWRKVKRKVKDGDAEK
jgi:hypothetical protein